MGRRKTRRKPNTSRQLRLEKRFNCPICSHEIVVQCAVKRTMMKGFANCSVCEASFVCDANKLTTGVDVYYARVDECYKG